MNKPIHDDMNPERTYYENGQLLQEEWFVDGMCHRLDGPAYRLWHESGQLLEEEWWIEGLLHRVDGPAAQRWDMNGQLEYEAWHIDGVPVEPPISSPLAWALWVAKNFGDVHGLEKFCKENLGEKAARAILASVKIR